MTLTLDLFNFMLAIPLSAQSLGWGLGLQHPRVLQEQMPQSTLCQQGLAWRGCDLNPWHLKSWRNICFPYHRALRNYRKEKPPPERELCVQFGSFAVQKPVLDCLKQGITALLLSQIPSAGVSGSVTEVMLCCDPAVTELWEKAGQPWKKYSPYRRAILSNKCVNEICVVCTYSSTNAYMIKKAVLSLFSYKITSDCYSAGFPSLRFLFWRQVQGTDLSIWKGSFFSNPSEYMLYIPKMTKSSVTNNSIC